MASARLAQPLEIVRRSAERRFGGVFVDVVQGAVNILPTLPIVRRGLRRLLGSYAANLIVFLPSIISLMHAILSASSPFGLAVAGVEALQLFGKMGALRAA